MTYLAEIVRLLFAIYIILIFIRVLFAWLRPNMFNPIVRFVYTLTDPYLKLFGRIKFLKVGVIDLTPILAFFLLFFLMELSYEWISKGYITPGSLLALILVLMFRFVYFILFIFIIAVGLRFIFDLVRFRSGNIFVSAIYSLSEPAVRPVRRALGMSNGGRFDISVFISLVIIILFRYLLLPRILRLLMMLINRSGI